MKQFRMMALVGMTLVMGLMMASCFGDSNGKNKATQNVIALYQNGTLEQYGGGTLIPTNPSYLPSSPGIYTFSIEYDPTTWQDGKLNVTITSVPVSLNNTNVYQGESTGNINLYDVEYSGEMYPSMFNENYILIPCIFWMENVNVEDYDKEEGKHKFSLFVPEDLHNSEGILNLTLVDDVTDPELERTKSSYLYQAFNVGNVITAFKQVNGRIKTIRIWGNCNRVSYDPTDGRTTKKYTDVDLTPFQ